jgi:hypothetical protein
MTAPTTVAGRSLKFGAETIYTPPSWLGVGALRPTATQYRRQLTGFHHPVSENLVSVGVSDARAHHAPIFEVFYGAAYFLETKPATTVPSGPVTPYGYGAPGITGPPDENVFKIQVTMWW